MRSQVTKNIIMIRPKHFGFNEETAKDNVFQNKLNKSAKEILTAAQIEFDNFVKILREHKINIEVFEDRDEIITPDSVFPNNWISFHQDGSSFIYKMFTPNRKSEIRLDIIERLINQGFKLNSLHNLDQKKLGIIEGTGALVLDRVNKIAYCSISKRADKQAVENWCLISKFKPVFFESFASHSPIYHTNVMMAIADKYALICLDAINNLSQRKMVKEVIENSKKEIIEISLGQVENFLGNALQVTNGKENFLVMSNTAFKALKPKQKTIINKYDKIISTDISTIEKIGGGSARCMLAENFLERE